MKQKMKLTYTFLSLLYFLLPVKLFAQDFTIAQNTTGNNRNDLRGQIFVPGIQEDGSGSITSVSSVYLTGFNVVYASGTEAATLYIYSTLPNSVTSLDDGTGGVLVGTSTGKEDGDFPFTRYNFNNLELDVNTTYYALFRQDVTLEFGGSIDAAGPYGGGKMLINGGATIDENDFTALRFEASFNNALAVNATDVAALKKLHEMTDGDNWTTTWDIDGDPLSWFGVTWDNQRVVNLNLRGNNLTGNLPEEIGDLTQLTLLNLGNNNLTGELPSGLFGLTNLIGLTLDRNDFSGAIPTSIANLTQLISISLASNNLTGEIPSQIGTLTDLESLRLGGNLELGGTIPTSFASLTKLKQLSLFSLQLTGEIPAFIWTFTDLTDLDLGGTSLSGTLPAAIGNLVNLLQLDFQNIGLSGSIPSEIGQLTNLTILILSGNEFSGTLPSSIGNLVNLEWLIASNNVLEGTIPAEIGQLTNLELLELNNNGLVGPLPTQLANLTAITELYLEENQFSGNLPTVLTSIPNLMVLDLSGNQFSGELPAEYYNFPEIELLDLGDNQIIGQISTAIGNLSQLRSLSLNNNILTGELPDQIGNLTNLSFLDLMGNSFNGVLPTSMQNLNNLSTFKLTDNDFEFDAFEPIVAFLKNITNLEIDPQKSIEVAESLIEVTIGSMLTLSVEAGGANNEYQWFLEEEPLDLPSSDPSISIEVDATKLGTYQCKITNALITDLTLFSEEIEVTVATTFSLTPEIVEENALSVVVQTTLNKSGQLYYVLLPSGSVVPSEIQIIGGMDAADQPASISGNISLTKDELISFKIDQLTPESAYDLYIVAVGDVGENNASVTLSVSTVAGIAFVTGFPAIVSQQGFSTTFDVQTTRGGDLYFVVLPSTNQMPSDMQIKEGNDADDQPSPINGSETLTANESLTVSADGLDPDVTYDIYLVAEDIDGLFSSVQQLENVVVASIEKSLTVSPLIEAFPNPVTGFLNFKNSKNSSFTMGLYTLEGQRIAFESNPTKIDLSLFPSGLYLLQIVDEGGVHSTKLFKD